MNIVIIKYNAGNIYSVEHALKRLGVKAIVTADPRLIQNADKVIFPGVGEAATTMKYLQQNGLDKVIQSLTQPVLGICLGMQLLCKHSEEGDVDGLGIFDTNIVRFQPQIHTDKIPHMGWNTLQDLRGPLFQGLQSGEFVYFVHSYYAPISEYTIATCNYIQKFSAAIQKDNFYATQFHPEKSGKIGELILDNFLKL